VDVAYYNEKMRQEELLEQEIAGQMCNALEQNQFEMYFQPQYNHATHVMVGVEALARWNHPEKGLISPQAFIPLFEKNGFISKLDEYIWERACIFLRRRMDAGKTPLPISVNVSRVDIYNPALCET
ncbi:MAG: EAL domain-containing protein, partial [Clostridia bacterium]